MGYGINSEGLNAIATFNIVVKGIEDMQNIRSELKSVRKELDAAQDMAKSTSRVLKEAKSKGGATFGAAGATSQLKKGSAELKKWKHEVEQVNIAIKAQPKNLKHALNNIKTINQAMKQQRNIGIVTSEQYKRMGKGMQTYASRAVNALERVKIRVHVLKNSLLGLSAAWTAQAKQMQWIGRQMIVGISLPLALFAQKAISAFRDVEVAQVRFRKVSDVTAEEFEDVWVDKLRNISREFAQTEQITTELAADWAAFGLEGADLEALTEMTSQFALLGDIDISDATPYVRSVFATFGEHDIEATNDILEKFNAIENETALQTKDLADALPQVAPVAKQFGMSAEEVAASLAAMVEVGLDATESAHGLKFGLQRLLAPTNEAKEGIQDLFGMSFESWAFDAAGQARSIPELMTEIGQAMENAPDVLEAEFMSDVFGKRQVSRMTALTTDLADAAAAGGTDIKSAFDDAIEAAAADPSGVAKKELEAVQKSADFAIKQMRNELKMFMTDFGAELIDPFLKILKVLLKLSKWFTGLNDNIKTAIVGILAFAASLGPILYVLAQAKLAFATTLGAAARTLPALGAMTKDAVGAMHTLGRKILAVGDTVFDLGRHWGTAHLPDKVDAVTSGLGKMGTVATEAATDVATLEAEVAGLEGSWAASRTGVASAAGDLGVPVPAPLKYPGGVRGASEGVAKVSERSAEEFAPPVLPFTRKWHDDLEASGKKGGKGFISSLWSTIKGAAGTLWGHITGLFKGGFMGMWNRLINFFQKFDLLKVLRGGLGKSGPLMKGLKLGGVTAIIAGIIALFKGLVDNWETVWPKMRPGFEAIGNAAKTLWNAVKEAWDAISGAFSGLGGTQDEEQKTSAWQRLGQVIGAIAEIIAGAIEVIAWVIRNIVAPALEFLANMIVGVLNWVIDAFSNLADFVGAIASGEWTDALRAFGAFFWDLVFKPISHMIEALVDLIIEAVQWIVNGASKIANLIPGVDDAFGGAKDWLQSVQDMSFTHSINDFFDSGSDAPARWGDEHRESYEDGFEGDGDDIEGPEVAGPGGGDYEEEGEEDANDWRKGWYSAVKSSLDEIIGDMLTAAKDAMAEQFEKNLEVFDNRIEAIEKVEKAEKRLFQTQTYLESRKDMLRKRAIQSENYSRNRALAIYEGRVDDARMLDLEDSRNKAEHDKSVVKLDEDRRRTLLDQDRADKKERIKLQQEHEKEKQDILRESFEKQLDIIAEYTPKTVGEMQNMLNQITSSLWSAGVNWWPYIGATGMGLFKEAISDANRDIIEDAAWSGDTAAVAWLDAFVSGEVASILSRQSSRGSSADADADARRGPDASTPDSRTIFRSGSDRRLYTGVYGGGNRTWAYGSGRSPTYHTGGKVGGGAAKDVPATLQTGEYVVQRSAVSKLGSEVMARINKTGTLPMGGPGGVRTSPFVRAVSGWMGNIQGKDGWIGTITDNWMQGIGSIGGMTMAATNYVFEHLGGMVGGKTIEDMFGSIIPGEFTIIEQFARWIGDMFGLRLSSAHRTEAENRAVGGSPTSGHLAWDTVDISGGWADMVRAWQWLIENMSQLPIKQAIFANSQIRGNSLMPWGGGGHMDHIHIQLMEDWQNIVNTAYGAPGATGGALKDQVRNYANSVYGWSGGEWLALHNLIQKESSWIPTNQNASSGAYGLFQFMPFHWGPGHYLPSGTHASVQEQMAGGLRYIKNTYGSPSNALAFHRANNWYHGGGPVEMMAGGKVPYDNYPALLHRGETVLPQPISEGWERNLDNDTMGTTVNIYADSFVGDFDYFKKNMEKYDVEVKPRKAMAAGTNVRRISSRGQVNR